MNAEILSKINNRYLTAMRFHAESKDLFEFLAFPGFSMLHQYQYAEESMTQMRLKTFINRTCERPVIDKPPQSANLFEPLTSGASKNEKDTTRRWSATQAAFTAYETWERESLQKYGEYAKLLLENGNVDAYLFVGELIRDVSEEWQRVQEMVIMLRGMDYDMPTVTDMQKDFKLEYAEKLKKLYKKIPVELY